MASLLERAKKAEAECERLRQDNKYLGDRWAGQSATIIDMQIELTRWQKIAKEATAEASYNDDCITDEIPLWKEAKEKIKEDYREQAARELGIATSDHIRDTTKMMLTEEQRAALEIAANICSENVVGDLVTVHDVHQAGITIKNLVDRSWTSIAQDSGPRYGGQIALSTERRAALDDAIETIRKNWPPENYTMLQEALELVISMLDQSRPTWEITEERRIALGSVRMLLDALALKPTAAWDKERVVLHGMLEEDKK